MIQMRQSAESNLSRNQYRLIAWGLTLLFILAVIQFIYAITHAVAGANHDLMHAPLKVGDHLSTWPVYLKAKTSGLTIFRCLSTPACNTYYNAAINSRIDFNSAAAPTMITMITAVLAWRMQPTNLVLKDPGQGKWASLDDPGIYELMETKQSNPLARMMVKRLDKRSPLRMYVGHMIPWSDKDHEFEWKKPTVAYLRERASHENVLVTGAPGSGKTRGMFRQNIILDAHYRRTAIVFDMKWPQMDSGFGDMPLYWHRLGRPVYVFAPFSKNSMRIPLLDEIDSLDEALKLAKAIIAPPEYQPETGEYYKSNERRALAAMILTIAQGPTPTMKELQRLGQMTVAELQTWYGKQTNPEIKDALKSMFDQDTKSISSTLAGIVNKLQIFYNSNVARATSRGGNPGEIIDLHKLAKEGGLLLIGISSKDIQAGEGEILIQLVKRRIDKALLEVADAQPNGELPQTATYYLDELPGLGRMPYLMANLSQMRSKAVCLMLGVQNADQGSLVYTRDYWKALSTNNIGTRIDFIRGMSKDDARSLSEELGEYTVDNTSVNTSGHRVFTSPISADARKSESVSLDKRPLLSREEIQRFPPDYAAVFAKGQAPLLVATPAIDSPTLALRTPGGRFIEIKNQLYPLWKTTMEGVKNLYEESQALFRSLSTQEGEETIELAQSAPQYFQEWLGMILNDGCMARVQPETGKFKLKIRRSSLSERTSSKRDIQYFINEGWLSEAQNEEEITITQEGLEIAGPILQASLLDLPVRGPALFWARQHADNVVGYPNSLVKENDKDVMAYYSQETLSIPVDVAATLYGTVPNLPRIQRGNREFVELPLGHPDRIVEAIDEQDKKAQRDALAQSPAGKINPTTTSTNNDALAPAFPKAGKLNKKPLEAEGLEDDIWGTDARKDEAIETPENPATENPEEETTNPNSQSKPPLAPSKNNQPALQQASKTDEDDDDPFTALMAGKR